METSCNIGLNEDDEDDLADMDAHPWTPERRQWLVDLGYGFLEREGLRVQSHYQKAFDAFLAEEIGGNELMRRIMLPHLH